MRPGMGPVVLKGLSSMARCFEGGTKWYYNVLFKGLGADSRGT